MTVKLEVMAVTREEKKIDLYFAKAVNLEHRRKGEII